YITSSDHDYKIDVTSRKGQSAPLTKYGERLRTDPLSFERRIVYDMKPHEDLRETLRISDIYDMTKRGIYYVTVKRGVKADPAGRLPFIQVPSNRVKITVT